METLILKENQNDCPKCGADWDGGSILEAFIQRRNEGHKYWQGKSDEEIEQFVKDCFSPPYRSSRKIGLIVRGGHDVISYYQCPDCNATFDRFTGKERVLPQADISVEIEKG